MSLGGYAADRLDLPTPAHPIAEHGSLCDREDGPAYGGTRLDHHQTAFLHDERTLL